MTTATATARRRRCVVHGLHEGPTCPTCAELAALRARAERAEAMAAWLKPSWRAWRAAALEANARLQNLAYGRPVGLPRETPPDELLTTAERLAPAITAKRQELRQAQRAADAALVRNDLDDYLDDVACVSGAARAATVADRERAAAETAAHFARLEAELQALLRAAEAGEADAPTSSAPGRG